MVGAVGTAPAAAGAVMGGVGAVGTASAVASESKDSPGAAAADVAEIAGAPATRGSKTAMKEQMAGASGAAGSAPEYAQRGAKDAAIGTAATTAPGGKVLEARDTAAAAEKQKTLREDDANSLKTSASDAKRAAGDASTPAEGGGKGKVEE